MKDGDEIESLHGTLLFNNENDTERVYYVINCEKWFFIRIMSKYGWRVIKTEKASRNKSSGVILTVERK